jgi:uncharacterized coiled-coil DUF342 family protein
MTHEEMEEVKRHFGVVADGLRSDIRLVAEGHAALDLKFDTMRQEVSEFHEEFLDFRKDVQGEFRDLRALVRFSYAELDERVKFLERELASLRTRLDQIDGKQT